MNSIIYILNYNSIPFRSEFPAENYEFLITDLKDEYIYYCDNFFDHIQQPKNRNTFYKNILYIQEKLCTT